MKRLFRLLVFSLLTSHSSLLVTSCTQDTYDKGDGKYSLMRGDFAEAIVNSSKQVTKIVTDDGEELPLTSPFTAKWVAKADTSYRCMLYYNKVDGKAEVISMGLVPCASLVRLADFKQAYKSDPVKLQSVWMSKSGKYLNMHLQLMVGTPEDTSAVHQIALLRDTIITHTDSTRTCSILLHHDQNRQPEYYSSDAWLSLPVSRMTVDSFRVSLNTYQGPVVKTLSKR